MTVTKTITLVAAPEPPFTGTRMTILVPEDSRTFGLASVNLPEAHTSATINWGDGSEPTVVTESASALTHVYPAGGRYVIDFSDDIYYFSASTSKSPTEYETVYSPMIERINSKGAAFTNIPSRSFKGATSLVEARFRSVVTLPTPTASMAQFGGCDALREIHFAAANEEAIKATTGWQRSGGTLGAENATIYFDL